jgi:thiosulfate/3-mercaptopyruvate sulfurtransferase
MADEANSLYLVDADWLRAHRGDSTVVLDTRPGAAYWSGHLDGARHFDPFAFHHSDTTEAGLRNFQEQLAWIFSALGISGGETVVCYEENSGMRATRVAWALEYMGHPAVRILDGGLKDVGTPLVVAAPTLMPTDFPAAPREGLLANYRYIVEQLGGPDVQIFDVRTPEEYYGERVRARHGGAIPGAIHRDWVSSLDARGAFKPSPQLRAEFEELGLDPAREIIPYCQGAYRSANAYFALRLAGYPRVRNYLGSWAEWGNHDDLPIERPRRRAPRQ